MVLLGAPQFELGGQPRSIRRRKGLALAAYLGVTGLPHSREALATLLWPETENPRALGNLRRELSRLRRDLGEGLLSVDRSQVYLHPTADIQIDVRQFRSALQHGRRHRHLPMHSCERCLQALRMAVRLYQGDFMAGFSLQDSPTFDNWQLFERENLQQDLGWALQNLVDWASLQHRFDEGLSFARRLLALNDLHEPAHRRMMRLLAWSGSRHEALQQFEKLNQHFSAQLGIAPDEKSAALYTDIRRGDLALPSKPIESADPSPGDPPFKGLLPFEREDTGLFYGREVETSRLIARLHEYSFLAVVGASGSGKSSLVRAGLIPALQSGKPLADGSLPPAGSQRWLIRLLTPTAYPLYAIHRSIADGWPDAEGAPPSVETFRTDPAALQRAIRHVVDGLGLERLLLVVDQFEELFTHCRDEQEQRAFIRSLLSAAASEGGSSAAVVITLRADFYAHCAQFDDLRAALETQQVYIGQMNRQALRRAIVEPAVNNGWSFETGLVDVMLNDVGADSGQAPEPGALPLLSHALLETWKRRQGFALTFAGYADTGGVRGAVARTAETVFNQELTVDQQAIARNIFLRLTQLGEGTQATRRRASLEELIPRSEERPAVEAVLQTLTRARLLTTEEHTAQVAHEALIQEWPQLREWLDEDREGLRIHRQLTEATQEWIALGRDPGALFRGVKLARARAWAAEHPGRLNPTEQAFLERSVESVQKDQAVREAERQQSLEAAQKLAESESKRAAEQSRAAARLRRRALFLAVALVVATLLAGTAIYLSGFAFDQREIARRNAATATVAQGSSLFQAATAEANAGIAFSREVAGASVNNLTTDPERSILLALHALEIAHTREAEQALHLAVQSSRLLRSLSGHAGEIFRLSLSPDGMRLATASLDGTSAIWDLESGQTLIKLDAHTDVVWDVAFDPTGTRLATASADGTAVIWDPQSGASVHTLTGYDWVGAVAFNPDGTRLATTGSGEMVKIWDADTGRELLTLLGHQGVLWDVSFSPDGSLLATGGDDRIAIVWDPHSGQEIARLAGHVGAVTGVEFSPDGELLATSSEDGGIKIWNPKTGELFTTVLENGPSLYQAAFSPDGTQLAAASLSGTALVWDISGEPAETSFTLAGHSGAVRDVLFSRDGKRLITASADGLVKIWNASPGSGGELSTLDGHEGFIRSVVIDEDGGRLATAGWADHTARVWNIASGRELMVFRGHEGPVAAVDFDPAGALLATAGADGLVLVWDLASGQAVQTLAGHSTGTVGGLPAGVTGVDFSPDGALLATGGVDGSVRIWNPASGEQLALFISNTENAVNAVQFSPDGRLLASLNWSEGVDDTGSAKIWDVETGKEWFTLDGLPSILFGLAFSPDNARVAVSGFRIGSGQGFVQVWNLPGTDQGPAAGYFLQEYTGHTNVVLGIAFSPGGDRIASASLDGTLIVWDVKTGEQLLTLQGSEAGITDVVFLPDGRTLAGTNADGTTRLYLLNVEDLVEFAQSRLTRSLNPDECRQFLHQETCP